MQGFGPLFALNLRRRACDGFAIGYNVILPLAMAALTGLLGKSFFTHAASGFQYYSVVMIPFCIMMAVVSAAYAGKDDAYAKTAERMLASCVEGKTIVLVKILSETIVVTVCSVVTIVLCALLFLLPVLKVMYLIVLLFAALSFATAAVGTWIGLGMKNFIRVKNIMNLPISVFALAGGCFITTGGFDGILGVFVQLSPLTWINRSILLVLYDNQSDLLIGCSLICFLAGCFFTWIAMKSFKKEEYGNGELPGYEQ